MNIFRSIAVAAALFVTACGPQVASKTPMSLTAQQTGTIESSVREKMIDPESTRFRNIRAYDATLTDGQGYRYVCGEVNSKNRMGGYTGFTAFKGRYQGEAFVLEYVDGPDSQNAYYSCRN